jgi:hypothetical protein
MNTILSTLDRRAARFVNRPPAVKPDHRPSAPAKRSYTLLHIACGSAVAGLVLPVVAPRDALCSVIFIAGSVVGVAPYAWCILRGLPRASLGVAPALALCLVVALCGLAFGGFALSWAAGAVALALGVLGQLVWWVVGVSRKPAEPEPRPAHLEADRSLIEQAETHRIELPRVPRKP